MGVILSDECYLHDRCGKYQNDPNAACKFSNSYCPKLFRMNYLYDETLMTKKQRKYLPLYIDEDGTDREQFKQLQCIEQNIEQFVSQGAHVYIHSTGCGNGKSAWACRLIQSWIEKIWHKSDLKCRALFISVPQYLLALKDSISNHNEYAEHIKKNIQLADLVVFDEIGTKSLTTYESEHLLSIIEKRIQNDKSNIYTSNLNASELKLVLGDRLYSRIVNLSTDIEFRGRDKRSLTIG